MSKRWDLGLALVLCLSGLAGVAGSALADDSVAARREYNIQRVEGVPQKTVTPSAEHVDRILREQALVNAAKARRLTRPDLVQGALAGLPVRTRTGA